MFCAARRVAPGFRILLFQSVKPPLEPLPPRYRGLRKKSMGREPKARGLALGFILPPVRQGKLVVSGGVQVPAEKGLANHSYRVLQL
jgi:hypothetical protein